MIPEVRICEFRDAEVEDFEFRGYAAVFDTPWKDDLTKALGYVETIARGAFRKALGTGENVPLLGAHKRDELLASTQAGTLRVKEDGRGLAVAAQLPENYLGEYYREMIRRGDIAGMSYGMEVRPSDSIISKKAGVMHRSIANIQKLLDVTLTWEPAYTATSVELRSLGFAAPTLQELTGDAEDVDRPGGNDGESSPVAKWDGNYRRSLRDILERGGTIP